MSDISGSVEENTQPTPALEKDSIYIEFHPHSGKPTETYTFDQYSETFEDDFPAPSVPETNVFHLFHSRRVSKSDSGVTLGHDTGEEQSSEVGIVIDNLYIR